VVGLPHPQWAERPLLVIVPKDGASVEKAEILQFLSQRVAKWWLPDDVIFVRELPHTATGKVLKRQVRLDHYDLYQTDAGMAGETAAG
jgi:acyl-CoA synthetase (AMP-forming)/AMP-acid ligase II